MGIKNKIKKRHIVLVAGAIICLVIAQMCKTKKLTNPFSEDIEELH